MNYDEEQHLSIPEQDDPGDDFETADTYGFYESFRRAGGKYLNPNRDLFNDS